MALLPITALCQNDTLSKKQLRKQRPGYINVGMGIGYSYFRDFATSPLNYAGLPLYFSLAHQKIDKKREFIYSINYERGKYNYANGNSQTFSTVNSIGTNYSRLYQINALSKNDWNFKAGGMMDVTFDLRVNPYLQNNAMGSELFATLFASSKLTKDFSREETKHKKIWFVKYNLQPRERQLSFRLNLALINSTLRNGYAYSGQSYLVNDLKFFDEYQFNVFSGYRISSSLDYTYYLKNKNALQFSYVWDAYQTGGDLDKFEMAHHIFKFSLMFNTK